MAQVLVAKRGWPPRADAGDMRDPLAGSAAQSFGTVDPAELKVDGPILPVTIHMTDYDADNLLVCWLE
jgi:hypothetical protein